MTFISTNAKWAFMNEPQPNTSLEPDSLTHEYVVKAIQDFKENGYPKGYKQSHTYSVMHDGEQFSPPSIYALAIKQMTGELPKSKFSVGKNSKCFKTLENLGFKIVAKAKPT